jgi:prepilin-type processing-associated H-X9-DG protein
MRLEQELAADAWGAALSGGSPTYLMTLAQMALRTEDRSLAGPVRAFLPSRGTLITRIEMLKNTQVFPTRSLPAAARAGMIGLLALLGLAVAGLRGPSSSALALAGTIEPHAGQALGQEATRGTSGSLDLSLLPAETKLLLAFRPAALLENAEIKSLIGSIPQGANPTTSFVVPLEEMDQLLIFWEGLPEAASHPGSSAFVPPPSGMVIHSSRPQDWKSRFTKSFESAQDFVTAGQTCFRFAKPFVPGWCGFTPDDKTIVLAAEDTLRDLVADRKGPAPRRAWDEALDKSAKGQMFAALETRWLRRRLAHAAPPGGSQQPSPSGITLETIAPLLDRAQAYVVSLDASQGISVDIRAVVPGPDDAKPVADTLQAVLTLTRNLLEGQKKDSSAGAVAAPMVQTLELARSLLAQAKVETAANVVSVHAKTSAQLGDLAKQLAPAVESARIAARRAQSINNLKQIGLAFHNFTQVNGHLPAPALLGAENKRFPCSWRVALLPYLDQEGLYRQYHFDEPWDGPRNKALIDQMPAIYSAPGPDGQLSSRTSPSYYVFTGPTTALGNPAVPGAKNLDPTFEQIRDGTSNTILAVEWQGNVPWTKPDDIPFDPAGLVPAVGGFWPDGFNVLFCDGSVRFIKNGISPDTFKALITRAAGEVVSNIP